MANSAAPSFYHRRKRLSTRSLQNCVRRLVACLHNFRRLRSGVNNLATECTHRNLKFHRSTIASRRQLMHSPVASNFASINRYSTHFSMGAARNSSNGMPCPPISNWRFTPNALVNASVPGKL